MAIADRSATQSSDEELSDVDACFLDPQEHLLPDLKRAKSLGRPKIPKTTGVNARDKAHGRTALHKASSKGDLERVKSLLNKGADVSVLDNAGVSALHEAATKGHPDVVRLLLSHGASASVRDVEGDYPLLDAAQNDFYEVCVILLECGGANPTLQNVKGCSALSEAEEGPLKDLLRGYSEKFDSPGQNRMRIKDVVALEELDGSQAPQRISDRVRPRTSLAKINSNGARTLDSNGRDQLHNYVLDQDDDLVEQFLEIQDADQQDDDGDTPLHSAARLGNAHICGLLLDHMAKVNLQNRKGNTALHEAASTIRSRPLITALLDAGASASIANHNGLMPWQICAEKFGSKSPEAALLQSIVEKEAVKDQSRKRKRAMKKERLDANPTDSAHTSATNSPRADRKPEWPQIESAHDLPLAPQPVAVKSSSPLHPPFSTQDIAMTLATPAPPQIISSPQTVTGRRGIPTTQFLTELRPGALSQIDSSVRGSPLPPMPVSIQAQNRGRAKSPRKTVAVQAELALADRSRSPDTSKRKVTGNSLLANGNSLQSGHSQGVATAAHDVHPHERHETREADPAMATECAPEMSISQAILMVGREMVSAVEKQTALLEALLDRLDK